MGTRGLLGLIIQAQRHAAYNHFDSYPAGLGQEIVNFILSLQPNDYAIMERNLRDIEWVKEDTTPTPEVQKYYSELGFADLEVNRKKLDDWYCLLRKVQGAAALPVILKGNLKHMIDQVEFLDNVLFCEWAYFIDFDKQTLETWKGQKIGVATFEELRENKGYMDIMQKIGSEQDEIGWGGEVEDGEVDEAGENTTEVAETVLDGSNK